MTLTCRHSFTLRCESPVAKKSLSGLQVAHLTIAADLHPEEGKRRKEIENKTRNREERRVGEAKERGEGGGERRRQIQ